MILGETLFTPMSKKLKKGYYVKGQFVAEGSELDLELKRELKGDTEVSRTDLKRESTELQKLGEDLMHLRADLMVKLNLPEKLLDAIATAKKITNFEGKRRQMQFVGKLMRQLDPELIEAAKRSLAEQYAPSIQDTLLLHQSEQWRDRLIADDDALALWITQHPDTDIQQLRALVRQARKDAITPDAAAVSKGLAPRQGKAFRELFQMVRQTLQNTCATPL